MGFGRKKTLPNLSVYVLLLEERFFYIGEENEKDLKILGGWGD